MAEMNCGGMVEKMRTMLAADGTLANGAILDALHVADIEVQGPVQGPVRWSGRWKYSVGGC